MNTTQHNTTQHNTTQHNTTQHNTTPLVSYNPTFSLPRFSNNLLTHLLNNCLRKERCVIGCLIGVINLAFAQAPNIPGKFINYPGNPVLSVSGDEKRSAFGSVLKVGDTLHMYYTYDPTGGCVIGHATSLDGYSWTKDAGNNPVLNIGVGGKFDASEVSVPLVWKEDSIWYMFYTGDNESADIAIGYATSSDGVNWTRANTGNAVLTGDAGKWDENDCETGSMIKAGDTYYLWYNNVNTPPRQVGLATSTDLMNWTKNDSNPIFPDPSGSGRFCVNRFNYGGYHYVIVTHYTCGPDYSEFELYSDTVPTFYPSSRKFLEVIKETSENEWDRIDIDTPSMLTDNINRDSYEVSNGELWMYYAGNDGTYWQMGLAINRMVRIEEKELKLQSLELRVFPNPSTTGVRVQWLGVSEGQKISLKIYDLGGRLVKTLLNNEVISGNKIEVNLDELTKGIYFVKMGVGSFTATKKIILMREGKEVIKMEKQSDYIIKVDNLFPDPSRQLYCIRFRITSLQNEKIFPEVLFWYPFVEVYYENHSEEIFCNTYRMNSIWWGWKKIEEEWIKDGLPSLENKELLIDDAQENIDWAKDIAKELVLDKCKELDSKDGMPYSPPKRMGF